MSYTYNETRTDMPVYDEGTRTREDKDIIFVTTQSDKVNTDIEEDEPCGEPVDKSFNVPIKENKAVFCCIGINCPSHLAHPLGAKSKENK